MRVWRTVKRWSVWSLPLIGLLLLMWWQESRLLTLAVPAPLADQPVVTLDGDTMPLVSRTHKGTMVFFFAPWCHICHLDMATIDRFARHHPDVAVRLVALSWRDRNELVAYRREHDLSVPIVLGTQGLANAYRVEAFPTYYFIDRQGIIRSRSRGYATYLGLWWRSFWAFDH